MKLNCRPGDLAIKIKKSPEDVIPIGAIVQCIKFSSGYCVATGAWISGWEVEWNSKTHDEISEAAFFCLDEDIRPIRDQPGEDETLTWAPVPHKEMV